MPHAKSLRATRIVVASMFLLLHGPGKRAFPIQQSLALTPTYSLLHDGKNFCTPSSRTSNNVVCSCSKLMVPPSFAASNESRAKSSSLSASRSSTTTSTTKEKAKSEVAGSTTNSKWLASSRLGLNPRENRFHAPMVYHEHYSFDDWPPNHTFPMTKFARLANTVLTTTAKTHPGKSTLSRPLVRKETDFFRPYDPECIPRDWFVPPHGPMMDADFFDRFLQSNLTHDEKRLIGFREQTDRVELIKRTLLEVAGTILTAQLALQYGIASNLAGGTHHAHPTMGAGFTILNDLAITANFLTNPELHKGSLEGIHRVLVVDCDVHQGDGTAKFKNLHEKGTSSTTTSHIEPRLATLSLHCESNYPFRKAQSTYDIGLKDGMQDDEYLTILQESVNMAIEKTNPDIVLYDAGVDVYVNDKLGRLDITEMGIRRRDRWVLERCVSLGIPVAAVIGGGYDNNADSLARRHAIVHEECAHIWRKYNMWKL